MDMENESTENFEIKGKVNIQVHRKNIILTELYYFKLSKNIIRLTNLWIKFSKVLERDTKSRSPITTKNNIQIENKD